MFNYLENYVYNTEDEYTDDLLQKIKNQTEL